MTDDITKRLRVTMPAYKGLEISCPCSSRSRLMREAANKIERLARERDEARADVDRLRGDRDKMLLNERDFVRKHRAEIERLTRERDAARAEVEQLTRDRDEARYFLKIFVHAHASNNAVPPHIEGQARKALEAKP